MAAPARPVGARAKTGIHVLDDRLKGGFPRPSTLLLFSDKPTEKRIFGENFAVQGIRAGERSLYVDFFRAPQLARGELKRFGSGDASNLVLVDATSSQLLLPSRERYHIDDIGSLENIRETIITAVRAEKPSRIIIDSMEFLVDRFPKEDVLRLWRELIEVARATSISSRQRRRTSSLGNRSTRNSIESMMIRLGFSARTAVMMVSRMFSRLPMSSMWYRSRLGRRS